MQQLIKNLHKCLHGPESVDRRRGSGPVLPYQVLRGPCRNRPHPIEVRILGFGSSFLSRQGT